jgi:hypothetical protein
MQRFFLLLILFSVSLTSNSQSVFFFQKNENVVPIDTGQYKLYFNAINEKYEAVQLIANEDGELILYDSVKIFVNAEFDYFINQYILTWKTQKGEILQIGYFNKDKIADGLFKNYHNVDSAICNFVNGYKSGVEYIWKHPYIYVNNYKIGLLDGLCYKLKNKIYIEKLTEYENGLKNGIERSYWIRENRISIHYSDVNIKGKISNGTKYVYHPNGNVFVKQKYRNGLENGLTKIYSENGTLLKIILYKKGKIIKYLKVK